MKKTLFLWSFCIFFLIPQSYAQTDSIRNIILMIPDGTSASLLSITRWYKSYITGSDYSLAIDPLLCGLVKTHSSDAPIGDSAPTTSCYVTGHPSRTGFVATYPTKTDQDLLPIDETRSYQPLMTLPEAGRIVHGKSIGLVFTSYITDATPADCASHYYNRKKSAILSKQLVNNQIDVVMGGGIKYLKPYYYDLRKRGYEVIINDLQQLRKSDNVKTWALFEDFSMPYNIDRDTSKIPSLAEMTTIAIDKLSQNKKGFFLLVEGSKIDWAAHDNDAKTMIDDFLAFDDAVKVAVDFAKKDKQTVIIVLPDHGNIGIALVNRNSNNGYDKLSLESIMKPLEKITISAEKMVKILKKSPVKKIDSVFYHYYQIPLTKKERKKLIIAIERSKNKTLSSEIRKTQLSAIKTITEIVNRHLYIGFTTYGHTGEDVFLGIYHPNESKPFGLVSNIDIFHYLSQQFYLENKLDSLTHEYFTSHQQLFSSYTEISIDSLSRNTYILKVKKGENILEVESYNPIIKFNKEPIRLESLPIYVKPNHTFYLPKSIVTLFEE